MPLMTIGRQASNRVSSSFSYRVRVLKPRPVETRQSVSLSQSEMVERLSREMTAPLVAAIPRSRSSRGASRVTLVLGSIRRVPRIGGAVRSTWCGEHKRAALSGDVGGPASRPGHRPFGWVRDALEGGRIRSGASEGDPNGAQHPSPRPAAGYPRRRCHPRCRLRGRWFGERNSRPLEDRGVGRIHPDPGHVRDRRRSAGADLLRLRIRG